ncbi:MAG: hypothetical protein CYG60_04440 [Actinobacteria bacterium]|nr:MAG: hypothetical protein CYG60_04440 [Actinomycetota bacterium]
MDAPGPWGTGPFTLAEGHSSLDHDKATIRREPLACTWLWREDRTPTVRLAANTSYWDKMRGPCLREVVFRNDVSPERALDLVCTTEGEVDILTEVSPSDAGRVERSVHARLVAIDAVRAVAGVINRDAEGLPLAHKRARQALNLAVDRDRLVRETMFGRARPLAGLTPPTEITLLHRFPTRLRPYRHDAGLAATFWREGTASSERQQPGPDPPTTHRRPGEGIGAGSAEGRPGPRRGAWRRRRGDRVPGRGGVRGPASASGEEPALRVGHPPPGAGHPDRGRAVARTAPRLRRRDRRIPRRPRRPRVREAVRGARTPNLPGGAGPGGQPRRPVRLRRGSGALPLRAAGALRGQQARRLQGVPHVLRTRRMQGGRRALVTQVSVRGYPSTHRTSPPNQAPPAGRRPRQNSREAGVGIKVCRQLFKGCSTCGRLQAAFRPCGDGPALDRPPVHG